MIPGKAAHDRTDLLRQFVTRAISRIRLPDNTPVGPSPLHTGLMRPRPASGANDAGLRSGESDALFLRNTADFPRIGWNWRRRTPRLWPRFPSIRRLDTCVSYPAGDRRAVSRAWGVPEIPPSAFRGDVPVDGGHARWRNRRRPPNRCSDRRGSKRPNSDFRYSATSHHLLRLTRSTKETDPFPEKEVAQRLSQKKLEKPLQQGVRENG